MKMMRTTTIAMTMMLLAAGSLLVLSTAAANETCNDTEDYTVDQNGQRHGTWTETCREVSVRDGNVCVKTTTTSGTYGKDGAKQEASKRSSGACHPGVSVGILKDIDA